MVNVSGNRVSIPQIVFLAQCMEQFPTLALSNFGKSREETSCAHKKWIQIGSALNKIKPGVTKKGLGWLRYWTCYKYQLRKRYPQFKLSWVTNKPVRVTPLERRFLKVLSDHERDQPPHVIFQPKLKESSQQTLNTEESETITDQVESSESEKEICMPLHVDVILDRKDPECDGHHRDDNYDRREIREESIEDPIKTENQTKEELQTELLRFNLKRQREMHELEISQMKERHKLEMEILQLKKRKLITECERIKNNYKII